MAIIFYYCDLCRHSRTNDSRITSSKSVMITSAVQAFLYREWYYRSFNHGFLVFSFPEYDQGIPRKSL